MDQIALRVHFFSIYKQGVQIIYQITLFYNELYKIFSGYIAPFVDVSEACAVGSLYDIIISHNKSNILLFELLENTNFLLVS